MAAAALLCVGTPGSSAAKPQEPWPPRTPYDSPPENITPPVPPEGGARGTDDKASKTPYDAPPQDTAPPDAESGPGSQKLDKETPPPQISPPMGLATPPPAPAAPLAALPKAPDPTPALPTPAAAVDPTRPPGSLYGRPMAFQARLPPPALFGAAPTPAEPGETDWLLVGGITSIGLGAGMFVVLGLSMARIDRIQDEPAFELYQSAVPANQSVCEQAAAGQEVNIAGAATARAVDELCSEADTLEVLSYVSLGTGAALLGLGGILIVSSDAVTGGSARLRVDPRIGPGYGSLQVSYRF